MYRKEILPLLVLPLLDYIKNRPLLSTIKKLMNGEQCFIKTEVLLKAITQPEGPAKLVDYLLSYGIPELSSYKPLHTAATLSNAEVMKVLLKHGYYVDFEDEAGSTALEIAIKEKHTDTVACLLAHGAICTYRLPEVVLEGDLALVKLIFQYEKTPYLPTRKDYPMYLAAAQGHLEVVKFFLLQKVPYHKEQLFSHALQSGSSTLVAFLLSKNIYDKAKMKKAQVASSKEVITGVLLSCVVSSAYLHTIQETPFALAVWGLGLLAFYGYRIMLPQALDKYLHVVAKKGYTAVMQVLLPYTSIDLKAPFEGSQDMSALHVATRYNHLAMVQFLVKKGAMINAVAIDKEKINKTPLDLCLESDSPIHKFLIKHGAKHSEA